MKIDDLWDYLPEEWQWVATGPSGHWSVFRKRPRVNLDYWDTCGNEWDGLGISLDYDGPWEESLHERPKRTVWYWKAYNDTIGLSPNKPTMVSGSIEAPPEVAEWFRKVTEAKE